MPRNSTPFRTVVNENIECPVCSLDGVEIITRSRGNFQDDRTYRCIDCDSSWKVDDFGEREFIHRGVIGAEKTPIDMDRELGVVPEDF